MADEREVVRIIISFAGENEDEVPIATALLRFPDEMRIPFSKMQSELSDWMMHLQTVYSKVDKNKVN